MAFGARLCGGCARPTWWPMPEKKQGRKPRSIEQGDVNAEIDRLLVEGELVTDADGKQVRVYPMSREVAERLGVSPSWVSKLARQNRCFQRRAELRSRIETQARE